MSLNFSTPVFGTGGAGSSLTISNFEVPDVSNRLLIVAAMSGMKRSITGVTFDGDSLTSLGSRTSGNNITAFYYMKNPGVKTGNIVVSYSSTYCYGNAGAYVVSNVDLDDTFGTTSTNSGTGTGSSVDVSSASGEVVIDVGSIIVDDTATAGTNQTELGVNNYTSSRYSSTLGLSYKAGSTTTTMTWTFGSSGAWCALGVSIKSLGPSVDILETDNIGATTARVRGQIIDDVGKSCEGRFRYRKYIASPPQYYPVVEGYNTSNTASGTSHTVNLPSGIQAGELLLVFFYSDGSSENDSPPEDWERIGYQSYSGHSCGIFARVADGEEGSTITCTTASTEATAHISLRISGWTDYEISSSVNGLNSTPDPPNLEPSWGSFKNLWFAIAGGDYTRTISSYPTGYDDNQLHSRYSSSVGCWVGCATKEAQASSENPGTFTISAPDDWTAWTIAIKGEQDEGEWTYTSWKNSLNTNDIFTENLSGLDLDTSYEVQAQAQNSNGESAWTSSDVFTTLAYTPEPGVVTNTESNVQAYSFQANGGIIYEGDSTPHTRGFCYIQGVSGDPTTADDKVFDNGGGSYGVGSFSKTISGLLPETSYRVRAYAINNDGTGYGITITVTTSDTWNYEDWLIGFSTNDEPYEDLADLLCGTEYEFQVRVRCAAESEVYAWTESAYFTTISCGAPRSWGCIIS